MDQMPLSSFCKQAAASRFRQMALLILPCDSLQQAKGNERYDGFVEALGRRVAKGRTLADEIAADIAPAEADGGSEPLRG